MKELPESFNLSDPGDYTYYVSDERLRAFKQLTPEQKLQWVEKMATFLRMAKLNNEKSQKSLKRD